MGGWVVFVHSLAPSFPPSHAFLSRHAIDTIDGMIATVLSYRYYTDDEGKRVYTLKVRRRHPRTTPRTLPCTFVCEGTMLFIQYLFCHDVFLSLAGTGTLHLLVCRIAFLALCSRCLRPLHMAPSQKLDGKGRPTYSAHPARFSPDDKYSRHRVTLKKRFGILLTQTAAKPL